MKNIEKIEDTCAVNSVLDEELLEFQKTGFARASSRLLRRLRTMPDVHFKIFRPGLRTGSITGPRKFCARDMLGDIHVYYYDVDRRDEFVDFLVDKFYEKNNSPSMHIRIAFTKLLHTNGLHWIGCQCSESKRNKSANAMYECDM